MVVPLAEPPVIHDEISLVARAQSDREAFALLYRQYLTPVYRYCYRRLGSREAAEDATSQIFAQALAALPRYTHGSFRAWLFTIAHHVVIDAARRVRPGVSLEMAEHVADPALAPEDVVLRAEQGEALAAILQQLPPAQRQVLELRLAGLTAVEIAAVLGRSHGTIRNLQHRTLVHVRHLLERDAEERRGHDA